MLRLFKTAALVAATALMLAASGQASAHRWGNGGGTSSGGGTPVTAGVRIISPLSGTGIIPFKAITLAAQVTDPAGSAGSVCTVDWGDSSGYVVDGYPISATTSSCGTAHAYLTTGLFYITVTGTDANGVVGTSTAFVIVF